MALSNHIAVVVAIATEWTYDSVRHRLADLRRSQPAARQRPVTLQCTQRTHRRSEQPPGRRHRQQSEHGVAGTELDHHTPGDFGGLRSGHNAVTRGRSWHGEHAARDQYVGVTAGNV